MAFTFTYQENHSSWSTPQTSLIAYVVCTCDDNLNLAGTINLNMVSNNDTARTQHTQRSVRGCADTVYHHQWGPSPPVFRGLRGFVSARQPTVSTVTVVQMSPAATEMTGRTGAEEECREGRREGVMGGVPALTSATVGWATGNQIASTGSSHVDER